MNSNSQDQAFMQRALDLAIRGQGRVEPNPMVGCVIVRDGEVVGKGFHAAFGQPHAESEAIRDAGQAAAGATFYITLEPCCHIGKTPPCTKAIIAARPHRVVVAGGDPFAQVAGQGLAELRSAGIEVETGVLESAARHLNAPYFKRVETGRPWIIAKWAMSLDGKIATTSGDSRWISGELARRIVHQLRGRVDGIVVGRGTAEADDPLLTARPPGPRIATRIVFDSEAKLSLESQLVKTARDVPVLIVSTFAAPDDAVTKLTDAGCEVLQLDGEDRQRHLTSVLENLADRDMTNLLIEGGGQLLGSFLDAGLIDEVHVFVAPTLIGGSGPSPAVGIGIERMADSWNLTEIHVESVGNDAYIRGRIERLNA